MSGNVGTKLHELFNHVITDMSDCNCAAIATKMDQLGPPGCREQVDELASEIRNSATKWKDAAGKIPWRGRAECNSDLLQNILNRTVAILPLPPAAVFRLLILHACDLVEAEQTQEVPDGSQHSEE